VDVRAIRFELGGVSVARFALPKWPALVVGVSGEYGRAGAAVADGALCRISARQQLNLFGHVRSSLFFLEPWIVGGDGVAGFHR
jgi:hypothetical protein